MDKAQKKLIKLINNAVDWQEQSQILLGLSLHTMQDYFAHVIKASLKGKKYYYHNFGIATKNISEKHYPMYLIDDRMGLPNSEIEDNTNVFTWRFEAAKSVTYTVYHFFWQYNKKLTNISTIKTKTVQKHIRTVYYLWRLEHIDWTIKLNKRFVLCN